ncbi:surface lipoprotein assembly modifier [Salipiger sp.]|uniref:surface lipoprotein assembly modifier n=1 Tax=Salipiger sp. TaxID=2078585 RepID=UPI003A988156
MRRGAHALCLTLAAVLSLTGPLTAEDRAPDGAKTEHRYELTLPQLQTLSAQAIQTGRYALAVKIAGLMLTANPDDPYAHFIIAQAYLRGGDAEKARQAARKAYRFATTDVQKHEAARAAAMASARQERYFGAQIWMRRALAASPDAEMTSRAANEFRAVRSRARLSVDGSISVAPSSNVNGGSTEEISTVEGLPLVGILSPTAQALSGTEARGELTLRYRLHRTETSQTDLRAHGSIKRVWLSEAAQDKAPRAENADFGTSLVEFGLLHRRKLSEGGPLLAFGAHVGRAWSGGEATYDFGRISATLIQPLGDKTALTLGLMRQEQYDLVGSAESVSTRAWSIGIGRKVWGESRITLAFQLSDSASDNPQAIRETRGVRAGFELGPALGPVKLGLGLSATESDYPDYRVLLPVPGGRQDRIWAADVDLTLHKMDYAGFVPTVRFRAERSTSNVSRFETEDLSVTLGFKSRF